MKKVLCLLISFVLFSFLYAQKVNVLGEIPFGTADDFNDWFFVPEEGLSANCKVICAYGDKLILSVTGISSGISPNYYEYNYKTKELIKKIDTGWLAFLSGEKIVGNLNNGYVYGNFRGSENYNITDFILVNNGKETHFYFDDKKLEGCGLGFYCTDDTFYMFSGDYELTSIRFNSDGSYIYQNKEETQNWLTPEKIEELGITTTEFSETQMYRYCFGEHSIRDDEGVIYWNIRRNNFNILNEKYKDATNVEETSLRFDRNPFGVDRNGLIYFTSLLESDAQYRTLAVLDTWTSNIMIYEDLPESIHFQSSVLSPDGKIIFVQKNRDEGKYVIKELENIWYETFRINERHMGAFLKNHIPLFRSPSVTSETDGFNFENDIVWEKETNGEWSRIQKLDGREGWVQSKYIKFYDSTSGNNPSCNITVNKIMQPNDNLRLRKQEATSSEIITTMLKGTKVKILQLGSEETIDGIRSCWVQVEVLAGGKDKNGKDIKEGTIGWCYGGFLE